MAAIHARLLAALCTVVTLGATLASCHSVDTNPAARAAVSLDTVLAPGIVAGDSLRDTLGVAIPLHGNAYNIQGDTLGGFPLRYRVLDSGVFVDSVTGYAVGDTVRTTAIRVVADAAGLQTQPVSLFVVPSPDTVVAVTGVDTLVYSLRDSSANVSSTLYAGVWHWANPTTLTGVQGWAVSFAIQYPADTALAQLVGGDGRPSRVSSTDAHGSAGIRVRVRPERLTALADSVVVVATARYRGAVIIGSPARLVLRLQAPAP